MKYFFTIARYNDYRQKIFENIISPRNQEYCDKYGYKYIVIGNADELTPFRGNITWNKISIIRDLISSGKLQNDDIIVNFDADMLLLNDVADIAPDENHSMAISIDSGNTFCFGWTSYRISDWTKDFINNILSETLWKRQQHLASYHEGFPNRPPYPHILEFREQAAFYILFGIKRHSNQSFWTLPDNGIHSSKSEDTIYNIVDFNKHIQLFPTGYNTTIWEGESDTTFNINKIIKEEVKIRHLTGCDWNVYKNWI
jgi:hypothetical protein